MERREAGAGDAEVGICRSARDDEGVGDDEGVTQHNPLAKWLQDVPGQLHDCDQDALGGDDRVRVARDHPRDATRIDPHGDRIGCA